MNEDKIIKEIIDLKDQVRDIKETMTTKKYFEAIANAQDQIMVVLKRLDLKRLDEERVFTFEHVKRLETEMEDQKKKIAEHGSDLKNIKLRLQIA